MPATTKPDRPPPINGAGTAAGAPARASVLAAPTNAIPIARRSNIARTPNFFRQRKPILQMPPEFLIFFGQTASGSSRVFREANYATGRRRSVDGGKHFCDQAAACAFRFLPHSLSSPPASARLVCSGGEGSGSNPSKQFGL